HGVIAGLVSAPPYPPPQARVGAETVRKYRDGRDKPGHGRVGAATSFAPSTQRSTRGPDMKQFLAAVVIAVALTPAGAFAQERVADAALGGLSGAIVFGPVGAVAGIVVGYTAGPGISRSWWGQSRSDYRYRTAQRSAVARSNNAELRQATAQGAS